MKRKKEHKVIDGVKVCRYIGTTTWEVCGCEEKS